MGIEKNSLLLYYVKWTFEDSGDTDRKKYRILRKEGRIIDCFVDSSCAILNPVKGQNGFGNCQTTEFPAEQRFSQVSGNYAYPSRVGQKIIHDPIKGQKGKEL